MGLKFAGVNGEHLSRSTSVPANNPFTVMGWSRIDVDTNAFQAFYNVEASIGVYFYCGTNSDGTTFALYNASSVVQGSALSVGTWYHTAMVMEGTGAGQFKGYLNGVLDITHAGNAALTPTVVRLGCSGDGNPLNGALSDVKVYDVALTAVQIQQEMWTSCPKYWVSLNSWAPMHASAFGDCGQEYAFQRHFTVTGTLVTTSGPPVSYGASPVWRYAAATGGGAAFLAPPNRPIDQAVARASYW